MTLDHDLLSIRISLLIPHASLRLSNIARFRDTSLVMGRGEPEFNLREKADYGTPAAGAHVRRKFFEAVTASDDGPPSAQELKRPNLPLRMPKPSAERNAVTSLRGCLRS